MKDSKTNILRYVPDDDLSARLGLSLPTSVHEPIGDKHYELSLAAPLEPVILTSEETNLHGLESTDVKVMVEASVVEASVVDIYTRILSNRSDEERTTSPSLGKFFAGRTILGIDPQLPIGSQVVGWPYNARRKVLKVPARQLYLSDGKLSSELAAAVFAALTIASCIVYGVARAREGDIFLIQFDGMLEKALQSLCRQAGAVCFGHDGRKSADFVLSLDPSGNLLINGCSLPIEKYLDFIDGSVAVARTWDSIPDFT